jgi:hypothetical protein
MTTIPVNIKALPGVKVHVDNRKDPTLNKRRLNESGTIFHVKSSFYSTGVIDVSYAIVLDRRSPKGNSMFVNLSEEYFELIQPD